MTNVKGYVLIETNVGEAGLVARQLRQHAQNGHKGKIGDVSIITGPFDVIAAVTGIDIEDIGNTVTGVIQKVSGVQRTTTCLAHGGNS